jgi:hypothetical protein
MKIAGAVVIGLVSATLCTPALGTPALAEEPACKLIGVLGSSLLQQCGDQLHSFGLDLSDMRREVSNDQEGRFSFDCPVSLMCTGSPSIGGFFIDADKWKKGAKDAQAIGQILQSPPMTAEAAGAVTPKPMQAACEPFDVTISGTTGKGVCFNDAAKNTAAVAMVFADDDVGFLLNFSQPGIAPDKLRDSVVAMLAKFKIERAKGDVGLLRWMR